jgi:hypothetical protein
MDFAWGTIFSRVDANNKLHIGSPGKVLDCPGDPFTHGFGKDVSSKREAVA